MKDKDFLIWIHNRLTDIHHESPALDYMRKLRAIIQATPDDQETPDIGAGNNIKELLEEMSKDEPDDDNSGMRM
jgi:hypothetical protein